MIESPVQFSVPWTRFTPTGVGGDTGVASFAIGYGHSLPVRRPLNVTGNETSTITPPTDDEPGLSIIMAFPIGGTGEGGQLEAEQFFQMMQYRKILGSGGKRV